MGGHAQKLPISVQGWEVHWSVGGEQLYWHYLVFPLGFYSSLFHFHYYYILLYFNYHTVLISTHEFYLFLILFPSQGVGRGLESEWPTAVGVWGKTIMCTEDRFDPHQCQLQHLHRAGDKRHFPFKGAVLQVLQVSPPCHSWAYSSLSNTYTRVTYVRPPTAPGAPAGTLKWPVTQPVPQSLGDFWDIWVSQKPVCSGKMACRQERCTCEGNSSWGNDRLWFYLLTFLHGQPLTHVPFVPTVSVTLWSGVRMFGFFSSWNPWHSSAGLLKIPQNS